MTKLLKDTGISQLLEISAGNLEVLSTLMNDFRKRVEESAAKQDKTAKAKLKTATSGG